MAGGPPIPGKIRVLIADDHVTVREGLAAIIGRQPDMVIVGTGSNGREVVDIWRELRPDVTLLDLRMPDLDGISAMIEIRKIDALARIIVLTTFDMEQDVSRSIKAGAKGYLLKDAPREELIEGIRRVYAGETCIPPTLTAKLAAAISNEPLTAREQHVLNLLAKGMSNKVIGSRLGVSSATVKTHLRSIFGKLDVLSRSEAIAVATRRGLVKY